MQWKVSNELVDYQQAVSSMEQLVGEIIAHTADELVWLLEHPPIYTKGTGASDGDLLDSESFPIYTTGRGGKYTYHGPGQRVCYLMLDLKSRYNQPDIKQYVYNLEQLIIESLKEFDIDSNRAAGRVGIWVGHGNQQKKIAAIGVRIKKWVTYHGIAININPDLSHFNAIIPCGIKEFGVTSIEEMGINCSMKEFDAVLRQKFDIIFK
jgi:lipoyl(octanoyl) transferase